MNPPTVLSFNNTGTGLVATNVQSALDEINSDVETVSTRVQTLEGLPISAFPDTNNVIQATTDISTTATYTATVDCIVAYDFFIPGNSSAGIQTNNVGLVSIYSATQLMEVVGTLFVPAGKTITLTGGSIQGSSSNYTVYGIYASSSTRNKNKKAK